MQGVQTDFELSDKVFHELCEIFEITPIGLFATILNTKSTRNISWKQDQDSIAVDYDFPPF